MKEKYRRNRHTSVLFQFEDFRQLLSKLYPGRTVYVDAEMDGLYIGLDDDDLPTEDLHERLAAELDVSQVTSIHIDDYEPCCVWVTYRDFDEICRSDYIATKLWSREDVESTLIEEGYEGTKQEIDEVINTGYLKALGDCTDSDWDIIKYAIRDAAARGNI